MKKRTALIVASLLVGVSSGYMIYYISSSNSAYCEHPIGPDLRGKPRFSQEVRSQSDSNAVCEHPTSMQRLTNQRPNQLENTNRVEQPKPGGQQK